MPKSLLHIKTAEEAETVFYESFMRCDIDVMTALWAEGNVICVHPGTGMISGHAAVIRSWRHIFANANPARIRYTVINKTVCADLAVHFVTEEFLENNVVIAVVIATNVYRKYENGWLLIEHHASVVQQEQRGRSIN